MSQKVLITGGTGLVGKRLAQLLLKQGYDVAFLSRKKESIPSIKVYEWNVDKGYIEDGALFNTSHLIHLAGAGVADGRWTEERKKVILESRTKTIQLIAQHLKQNNILLQSFVSASGISYYGEDTGDLQHTENDSPGNDFLSNVTVEWEKAADAIAKTGIRTVKLRTGIVLSSEGGALSKMALPAKFGFGAALGTGKQWISWIHEADLCNMYLQAMTDDSWNGAYNAVARGPVTNKTLTQEISRTLNRPQWMPNVPALALKIAFGEMANVVLGSNYIINHRIATETNFEYRFEDLGEALKDVLINQK
jgi:uncharacterized protein (TIGR01777 family)